MRAHRGNWLLALAGVFFVIGLIAIAAMFIVPAASPGHAAPVAIYGLTMFTPLGFLCALIFALRSGRRHPEIASQNLSRPDPYSPQP